MARKRYFYLTPVLGGPGAPRYPVTDEPQLVGRSERAAIALLEPTVSREHAAVQSRDGHIHLEDLGSKHGTFVNSKRVSTTKLKVGDIIVFGLSLVLRLEESDRPIPRAPTIDGPASEGTVSSVEPLPANRSDETRVTAQPTDTGSGRTTAADSVSDVMVARLREQLAKTHKLAGLGARSALVVPTLRLRLEGLLDAISRQASVSGEEVVNALRPLLDELGKLGDALESRAAQVAPTSLFDVVRRACAEVKPIAAPREIDLLVGVPIDLEVLADPKRLQVALVELLRNAAEASPRGQAVEIGARAEPQASVVELSIVDHGPGLPESVASRLFEPFVTMRSDVDAVGLGLYESHQLLASIGGELSVSSEHELGTTVRVVLPIA